MTYESQAVRDARIDVGAVIGAVVKRLPRIILLTGLLLAATFVLLMFMPRLYESSASILVEPRSNVYARPFGEQAPTLSGGEAGVVSSQIELIKSRDTLLTVIDKLDLRSVPEFNGAGGGGFSPMGLISRLMGRSASAPVSVDETVLNTLYERLTVIQERDSAIISVLVRSTDPQLAADIANAVAAAHVQRRAQLSISDTAEASSWMAEEIAKLRVTVTAAETAVADFKVDNGIFVGANNTSLADQQVQTVAGQITSAQERKNTALSRAALIRRMIEQGQPIDGVPDVRNSAVIQQLGQEKGRLQGELAQRSATLLPNHPTIQALRAQIAELNNQITLEGRRVADALEAEAQIEADLETSLQADLTRAQSSSGTVTRDSVTLDSLEREAAAQRNLLEGYLQRYTEAVSRVDSNSALPDVRVVTVAAPAVSPASPKSQLILLAVALVSLAVQVGLIVFGELISGRAIVPAAVPVRPQDELDEMPFVAEEAEIEPVVAEVAEPEVIVVEPVVAEVVLEEEPDDELESDPVAQPPRSTFAEEPHFQRYLAPAQSEAEENVAETAPDEDVFDAMAKPVVEPAKQADEPVAMPTRQMPLPAIHMTRSSELASDLVLGRTHLMMLAGHNSNQDCEALAEELIGDAIARGLSVALIDAGSATPGDEPGLTDLSTDEASFGDIVQKSADNSFAEVSWGRGATILRASTKPMTLVEALGDIYEVVILMTGKVGMGSSLPFFDGIDGRLVLVAGPGDNMDDVAETRQLLLNAGFDRCDVTSTPAQVAA
ncbi:MAG: GumC family protein [Candidatus Devosia phytovorans]|uniref:GumC family protein n=1 Tax=Candidatus Devosia phytovorans TaxID=3121372 RepID=A0AAJ5VYC4_9HYPH|nr:GumC family protein [Devosia sp.]WEK06430.1 MAG: GumC family protein [Devosia sp.]